MPLAMRIDEHRVAYATVTCDHCKKPIETAADGNCEWANFTGVIQSTIFFTHKRCSRDFESALGLTTSRIELRMLPLRLAANLDVDIEETIETARTFAAMGAA